MERSAKRSAGPVTFQVDYFQQRQGKPREFSHSYSETWEKTDLFCPGCGEQDVWNETGPGDYYVGTQFMCLGCRSGFHLPNLLYKALDEQDRQRWDAIWAHLGKSR